MMYRINIFFITWMLFWPVAILAEDAAKEESPIKTVKIVLYPMPEPRPALKYKLLPAYIDLKPGNAALFYNKLTAEEQGFFGDQEMWEKASDWAEAPLSKLREEKVRSTIYGWTRKINEIKRASQCEYCDWQVPIREYGYETPLPDLQQNRSYARLLAPYARLQIAEGKFDEAVETLQVGYALGRHAANGPTLVHALVGCSIIGYIMFEQVQEFVQQPDAPNLFWALTDLPRPIIDFRPAIEAEYDALYFNFPDLRNLETKELAPEQWAIILRENLKKLFSIGGMKKSSWDEYLMPAVVFNSYPLAKTFLIQHGWAADKVEAMPVCQVVLIAGLQQYGEIQDEFFKWMYLPYPEATMGMKKAEAKLREISRSGQEILPFSSILLPAVSSAKFAEAKTERQIAALKILEAIRLYGAAHDGKLPDRLSDITEVPIPNDPLNGTAFIYQRIYDTAILESPAPPGTSESFWLRYEIRFASKGK